MLWIYLDNIILLGSFKTTCGQDPNVIYQSKLITKPLIFTSYLCAIYEDMTKYRDLLKFSIIDTRT